MPSPMDASEHTTPLGDFDPTEALLSRWKDTDAQEPSKDQEEIEDEPTEETEDEEEASEETPEDESEEEESSDEEGSDDDTDEDDKSKTKAADDEYVTKVKVDGKEIEVKVGDLKRLYGQEQALTRKSQEVAAKRKLVEDSGATYVGAATVLLEKAIENYKPFQDIDFALAATQLEPEDYTALKKAAKDAYDNVAFLQQGIGTVMEAAAKQRETEKREFAKESLKTLQDPEQGIPGWDQGLYDNIRAYAIKEGLPTEDVNDIVSASAIKMMWKAMMYDKGTKAVTKAVVKKPKTIIKGNKSSEVREATKGDNSAMKRLRQSGSRDDAAEALLARWAQ